jgi:hypothetical protein
MANNFKSVGANAIGLTKTTVYTAPALTTSTVIGMSVSNILTNDTLIKVDIIVGKGASEFYILKGAPILPGGALVAIGGDQKVVLEAGNTLKVVSTVAASADVIISALEVS